MTAFLEQTLESLRKGRVSGPLVGWVEAHLRLAAWFVLAVGMVVLLVLEARDVGLLPGQWAALIVATVLVAGVCIWITTWEDEEEGAEEP
jgi:hypothetical protein